jgi:VanZ family protein
VPLPRRTLERVQNLSPKKEKPFASPTLAVTVWISLIFCSSTTWAGQFSETVFSTAISPFFDFFYLHLDWYKSMHFVADKSVHVFLFAGLAGILSYTIPVKRYRFLWIVGIGSIVGYASEILQRFCPGRDPAFGDVCIKALATVLGATLGGGFVRSRN